MVVAAAEKTVKHPDWWIVVWDAGAMPRSKVRSPTTGSVNRGHFDGPSGLGLRLRAKCAAAFARDQMRHPRSRLPRRWHDRSTTTQTPASPANWGDENSAASGNILPLAGSSRSSPGPRRGVGLAKLTPPLAPRSEVLRRWREPRRLATPAAAWFVRSVAANQTVRLVTTGAVCGWAALYPASRRRRARRLASRWNTATTGISKPATTAQAMPPG